MKKIFLLVAFGFITNGVMAQAPLEVGGVQLNAGVGTSGWGIPVYVGLDFGIVRDVTLGAQLSFQNDRQNVYGYNDDFNSTAFGIGANGNYHFNRILSMPSKFDFYAGANLTFYIWNYDKKYDDRYRPNNSTLAPGVQVGGRYFFTDNFGLNLELLAGEVGTTGAKFGITYKF